MTASREWESDEPSLAEEQVDALPDGTAVDVTWSGGNGPHRYTIKRDKWGAVGCEAHGIWHRLDFVGPQHPFTRVWLTPR